MTILSKTGVIPCAIFFFILIVFYMISGLFGLLLGFIIGGIFLYWSARREENKNPTEKEIISSPESDIDKKSKAWTPDPYAITIGICLIASMYLLPIFPGRLFGKSITLSQLVQQCSSSILDTCGPGISWGFYIVWIFSIGLIVFGLCARK